MKKAGLVALFLVGVVAGCGIFSTFNPPDDLWRNTHKFPGCPSRPSCVSSVATDEVHAVEPLRFDFPPERAKASLSAAIAATPGARIEYEDDQYIHAVFVTPKMKFHDDVELLVRPDGVIDVRSISRFGYGDHGVNRARVEEIRSRFDATKGWRRKR